MFFSTPLCGTCRVAERMLEVASATGSTIPLVKININFAPRLRERWTIESVPALVIVENGEPIHTSYAMRSAGDLYLLLKDKKEA